MQSCILCLLAVLCVCDAFRPLLLATSKPRLAGTTRWTKVTAQGLALERDGASSTPKMRTEIGKKYQALLSGQDKEKAMQILQDFLDIRDYNGFAQDVKTIASYVEEEMPSTLVDSIYVMVRSCIDDLSAENLSSVLWGLGRLATRESNARHRSTNNRLWRRICALPHFTSRQLTTSFVGLAKLNLRWNSMLPADRAQLERLVLSVVGKLNEREVGNLLHSLSRIGVTWSDMSSSLQNGILGTLVQQHTKMKAEHGTMTVYALGILGVSLQSIPHEARDSLYVMATELLQDVVRKPPLRNRCQQAANVVYGLAKMGAQFVDCPPPLRESILSTLAVPLQSMNAQEVSNTVYSLCILGLKWHELPREARATIQSAIASQAPRMITQGLSITLYGLGTMETPWPALSRATVEALQQAVVRCFRARSIVPEVNAQAAANAIYALGFCQVSWVDFPEEVRGAFLQAIELCGPHLKSQEVANLVYGLGMLRANYNALSDDVLDAIAQAFIRHSGRMLEQELCSFLHGLAKMEAKWDDLPAPLQDAALACIARLGTMNCVCLGCTVYSLGMLGAQWSSLPTEVASHIVRTAQSRPLADQTLSNTLYGLSLMGAEWDTLQAELRNTLLESLASPSAFAGDNPQHVSNTLWSLGKLDATWLQLPGGNLISALLRCVRGLNKQELANAVYGLAIIDVSWSALSVEVTSALETALLQHLDAMTVQEIANVMYSITLMSFDFHALDELDASVPLSAAAPSDVGAKDTVAELPVAKRGRRNKSTTSSTFEGVSTLMDSERGSSTTATAVPDERLEALWRIHHALQVAFKNKDPQLFVRENYDQFAIYFELMRVLKRGRALMAQIFGTEPQPSGPAGTVPSKMHAMTIQAMMHVLQGLSGQFECVNEFSGLLGVFPVDAAVYHDGNLVALVEVDGEFHYKLLGQQLRRKDRLKEFLYRCHYPNVPLYRMRSDQLQVIGYPKAGQALANWIYKSVVGAQAGAK